VKIAFLGDAHWGCRNNSDFFQRKQIDFYENQFFPYLVENNIKHVVQFGDLLDQRRFINIKTMNAVRTHYLKRFQELNIKHAVILGNHDIVHNNTSRLSALREIVGAGDEFNMTDLIDTPRKELFGDCQIDFLPWINKENYKESMEFVEQSSADILIGHLEINAFEMAPGIDCHHGMNVGIFKDYDMVYSGHFHGQAKRGNIHYIGTPYEMTWSDYGSKKGFHIFDTENLLTEFIVNTSNVYHKIIYDDTSVDYDNMNLLPYTDTIIKVIVEKKKNNMMFERFVDNIQIHCHELLVSDADEFEIEEFDHNIGFDVEDSLSVLLNSVDAISNNNLNKDSIKNKIKNIYSEAENILDAM
jgi:DNA repair exonuclease SbcCD nuclease subunit